MAWISVSLCARPVYYLYREMYEDIEDIISTCCIYVRITIVYIIELLIVFFNLNFWYLI